MQFSLYLDLQCLLSPYCASTANINALLLIPSPTGHSPCNAHFKTSRNQPRAGCAQHAGWGAHSWKVGWGDVSSISAPRGSGGHEKQQPCPLHLLPSVALGTGQYLWGGWEAPFRDRGTGRLPAVVLCLPVLCRIACIPSAEQVVAQCLFQGRGQWAGRSEVLGGNRWWGRDGDRGWGVLHPG